LIDTDDKLEVLNQGTEIKINLDYSNAVAAVLNSITIQKLVEVFKQKEDLKCIYFIFVTNLTSALVDRPDKLFRFV